MPLTRANARFNPTRSNFPVYMSAMLNDVDRNRSYEEAIKETIATFVKNEGRAPRVLDVGAGPGMLSLMCLKHGAKHVTLLEANSTLVAWSKSDLMASGYPTSRWKQVRCLSTEFKLDDGEQPFDMVVCELIGVLLHSESMYTYLRDLVERGIVASFKRQGRDMDYYYMIPQSGEMTLRAVESPYTTEFVTGVDCAKLCASYDAVWGHEPISACAPWFVDNQKWFSMADGWKPLCKPIQLIHEEYATSSSSSSSSSTVNAYRERKQIDMMIHPKDSDKATLVLEWSAQLSENVYLKHTLDHVATLPLQNHLARRDHWGFMFTPLGFFPRCSCFQTGVFHFDVTIYQANIAIEHVCSSSAAAPLPRRKRKATLSPTRD